MADSKLKKGKDTVAKESDEKEQQIEAIGKVYAAIKGLQPKAAHSVLNYVRSMVSGDSDPSTEQDRDEASEVAGNNSVVATSETIKKENSPNGSNDHEGDGISSVGHKWMKRNGIQAEQLGTIFSLGLDEIDLVAKKVPGKSIRERMKNVFLLKGIASYLGSGAARFTHDQVKEVCQHYDAWDGPNFAINFKSFASDVGGSKESGYNLTTRGLTSGTDLIKQMTGIDGKEK